MLDANRLIEMPRRHVAGDHALADSLRPRARLFVGDQRHRRRGAGMVALLALLLEHRRDIFGEGGRGLRQVRGVGQRCNGQRGWYGSASIPHGLLLSLPESRGRLGWCQSLPTGRSGGPLRSGPRALASGGSRQPRYFFAAPGHTTPWSFFVTAARPLFRNFCT